MIAKDKIEVSWSCFSWWEVIYEVWSSRRSIHDQPLNISWIPAHQLETTPEDQLTEVDALRAGTTVRHIVLNRRADAEAKRQALQVSPVNPDIQRILPAAVNLHQEWLTKLHCHLETTTVCKKDDAPQLAQKHDKGSESLTLASAPAFFPKWAWSASIREYKWKPKIPSNVKMPKRWRHSFHNWQQICSFLQTLVWKIHPNESSAFCEFAIAFHTEGHKLDEHVNLTMHDIFTQIRQCLQWLSKDASCQPFPGSMQPGYAKSAGKVLCQGAIVGASFYMTDRSLFLLASALHAGAGRTTESWKAAFPSVTS